MLNPSSTGNTSIILDFKLLIILLFIVTFLQDFLTGDSDIEKMFPRYLY